MEGKPNFDKIRSYSLKLAARLTANYFRERKTISGKEITAFCSIGQVNLFIVRELMIRWEGEARRLRSPWFNYEAPEVTEALNRFRNILSNHISIGAGDFIPLVEQAIFDSLRVVLAPYDYYADVLEPDENRKISVHEIAIQVKYLRVNRRPLEQLHKRVEEKGEQTTLSGKECFALLDEILESEAFNPEPVDEYIKAFDQLLPVNLNDLLDAPKVTYRKNEEIKKTQPSAQTSLYDELEKDTRPTLADNLRKTRIVKLRDHLTINQKFMFTRSLFNEDFELFDQAIERLDRMDRLEQAEKFIDLSYPEWNKDSEEYQEFRDLIERRFL